MTTAPSDADLAAYVAALRRLLAHGGYERTGRAAEAKKWDIDHIVAYLDGHGRPDRRNAVHVAGSKGKGSVATITEAILREAIAAEGGHTLLITSPDLHSARERIAIDGQPISHGAFARTAEALLDDPAAEGWSYFELLTVMGWIAGAEANCDWQVVEVGLGGRLDTTNAMHPASKAATVITPIDLEHTEILGDTIPLIAAEKAGIIVSDAPVIAAPMRASALEVVRARAAEFGAAVHSVPDECAMRVTAQNLEGQTLDLRTPVRTYRGLKSPLIGPHQSENIATAVRAAEEAWAYRLHEGDTRAALPEAAVMRGVAAARMPGRCEVVRQRPLTILDGLHTPLAARRFREAIDAVAVPRKRVWVIGMLAGKDAPAILEPLIGEGDDVIVAPPPTQRAADMGDLVRAVRDTGAIPQRAASIDAAIELATEQAGARGAVLVAGSLYTVAAAREHLLGIVGDRALGLR
ncbi:MAG: folylpolyglutamate synthase/dihydrofolate synthase family protein [Dehalococcoidia bacterium]